MFDSEEIVTRDRVKWAISNVWFGWYLPALLQHAGDTRWTCLKMCIIYLKVGKLWLWCLYRKPVNSVTSDLRIIDRYRSHPHT